MLRGWHPPCILIVALALATLPWSASTALAATREEIPIQVAGIFANGMVLQRGMPVPVWGWASPGRTVEVAFAATRAGHAAAIVTGPLHKEALHAAGYYVPGHT